MIKSVFFGLMLTASASAFAQSTTPTTTTGPGQPAPQTQPASPGAAQPGIPADPATPADPTTGTAATPATPATPATGSASTPSTTGTEPTSNTGATSSTDPMAAAEQSTSTAQSVVQADWAKYDTNKNERLSRTEFNKWATDLQTAAGQKAPTRSYLSSAFRKADADKSGSVSQAELETFLGSGS